MLSSMRSKSHKRFCGDRKSTRIREQEVGGKNRICTTQAMDCRSSIGPTNARVIGELSSVQTRERSLRVRPMHSIVQPRCGKRRPMTRAFSRRQGNFERADPRRYRRDPTGIIGSAYRFRAAKKPPAIARSLDGRSDESYHDVTYDVSAGAGFHSFTGSFFIPTLLAVDKRSSCCLRVQ